MKGPECLCASASAFVIHITHYQSGFGWYRVEGKDHGRLSCCSRWTHGDLEYLIIGRGCRWLHAIEHYKMRYLCNCSQLKYLQTHETSSTLWLCFSTFNRKHHNILHGATVNVRIQYSPTGVCHFLPLFLSFLQLRLTLVHSASFASENIHGRLKVQSENSTFWVRKWAPEFCWWEFSWYDCEWELQSFLRWLDVLSLNIPQWKARDWSKLSDDAGGWECMSRKSPGQAYSE